MTDGSVYLKKYTDVNEGSLPAKNSVEDVKNDKFLTNGSTNGFTNHNYQKTEIESINLETPVKHRGDDGSVHSDATSEEQKEKIGFFHLFRYADCLDVFLMIFGSLCAMLAGSFFVTNITIYGRVINIFIDDEIRKVMNNGTSDDNVFELVTKQCYNFLYLALGTLVACFFEMSCWVLTSERQAQRIRTIFFHSILSKHIGWFDSNKIGDLTTKMSDDTLAIQNGIGDKLAVTLQWLSSCVVGICLAFAYGWQMTLIVIAICPLLLIAGAGVAFVLRRLTVKEKVVYGKAGAIAEEVLAAIRTVAAFGGEKKDLARYSNNLTEAKNTGIKKGYIVGIGSGMFWLILFCCFALAMWYGTAKLVIEGNYKGGTIVQIFMSIVIAMMSLAQLLPNIEAVSQARAAAATVFSIIDEETEIDPFSEEGLRPEVFEGGIEFKDVKFCYPSRPDVQVLDGLSLNVKVGHTVALVGPSGCGKSTTIQLLQKFYNPHKGRVLFGGHDVNKLNTYWLRSHIGMVSQEPILFNTTIAENISYGTSTNSSLEQIEEAARQANAHEFIQQLPQKYETIVGERGAQLSGGQKQRIAIARALIANPKVLLLDEATSALDTESESIVQDALEKASKGRTTIVIAHRLSTIANADSIICIDNGQVCETGTHEQLMKTHGLYYNLVKNQENEAQEEESGDKIDEEENKIMKIKKSDHYQLLKTISIEEEKEKNETEISEPGAKPVSFFRIMKMNAPEWLSIVIGGLCACLAGAAMPIFASILSEIIGNFSEVDKEKQLETVEFWSGMMAVIGLGLAIATFLQSVFLTKAGEGLTLRVRKITFEAMLNKEISWFDKPSHSVGALCARLSSDASLIKGSAGPQLGFMLQALSTIVTALVIAFVYGWKLAFVVLGFMPFIIIMGVVQGKMMKGISQINVGALEEGGKIVTETLQNVRTVASLCKELDFEDKYKSYHASLAGKTNRSIVLFGISYGFSQCVIFICYATSFIFGSWLVEEGQYEYLQVFKVFTAITIGSISLGRASAFGPDFGKSKMAAANVFAIIDDRSEIDPSSTEGKSMENFNGELEFHNVSFTYPNRPEVKVLKNLDLKVKPGETLALVGSSGCGKSTIIQLIERFYDVDSGNISFANNESKDLNLSWMRSQIGIVSQEPVLFDMSIAENIAYGDNSRSVQMHEIIDAAKSANIHTFIESLPLGYETSVGAKGTQLSGGQKQRIAIARALIRNPKILLLDEATSALDTESEKVVQEALDAASQGRTCIVIAHRLSTVQEADNIVVMKNGQIIEQGTNKELIDQQGFYALLKNRKTSYAVVS